MRKKTTGQMTKIVLFISFIILVGRLLYAAVVAVPHHQEKKLAPYQSTTEINGENQDTTP
ncbi:YfgG family protein [Pseudomonas lundensis]|uniref:YfgG family protein n=1 Tax=Serratia proteamaculans TaxID=28151 RepID=UPI00298265E2|nr:YfgG family protein [Serratia proteamaculans]MDW5502534.1 YfgG family protein [Serratia proteamaculans]MDW5507590.1 YfgG family protein [Pseudomonas lundensis]